MLRGPGLFVFASVLALALVAGAGAAPRGIDTGFFEETKFLDDTGPEDSAATVADMEEAGGSYVRVPISWRSVAPIVEPAPGFWDPTDPGDPAYRFERLDQIVERVTGAGLLPILSFVDAPPWASTKAPDHPGASQWPARGEFADFMEAVSTRYSGEYPAGPDPLPEVWHYQLWNEPNLPLYFMPVFNGSGEVVKQASSAASQYRKLVNVAADRIRDVGEARTAPGLHTYRIIAGGLAPLGNVRNGENPGPLLFTKRVLRWKTDFDAWSTHPYTNGGPSHSAFRPNDVSLGDLPEMRAVLRKYDRSKQFWVTEFSWDTKKPDPKGVPLWRHSRWVSEAIHKMWKSGVSVLIWFKIYDQPCLNGPVSWTSGNACDDRDSTTPWGPYQSGLFRCLDPSTCATGYARKEPSFTSFTFPFTAYPERRRWRIDLWGRTPDGAAATVRIERRVSGGWRLVRKVRANSAGIFQATARKPWKTGKLRARIWGGESSHPFNLKRSREPYVLPFGS